MNDTITEISRAKKCEEYTFGLSYMAWKKQFETNQIDQTKLSWNKAGRIIQLGSAEYLTNKD